MGVAVCFGAFGLFGAFGDLINDKAANDTAAEFVREKIRGMVKNPEVAEKLLPRNHPIATKRPCVDIGYFETYNRNNVALVDLTETPIETITARGVKTKSQEYAVDSLVLATGFDAMTGSFAKIDIRGRDGLTLSEKWEEGPKTYLGLMVAGFPNMFLITGPGSPSVLSNMIVSIEQHVDWIADCLAWQRDRDIACIEATQQAEDKWVAHVNEVAHSTLYPQANSWYMGANIPGKPRVFLPYIGGIPAYRAICNEVVAKGYEGFALTRQRVGGFARLRNANRQRLRIQNRIAIAELAAVIDFHRNARQPLDHEFPGEPRVPARAGRRPCGPREPGPTEPGGRGRPVPRNVPGHAGRGQRYRLHVLPRRAVGGDAVEHHVQEHAEIRAGRHI